MATARVGGTTIHYEIHGEGEPLLLIMGLGSDLTGWMFQITELSARHRVVAFDNRGVGRSGAPDSPYSIEMMASDASGVMDAAGIGRAHVLGISMGGLIAQELALGHPGRIKSLCLATTGSHVDARGRYLIGLWSGMLGRGDGRELYVRSMVPWLCSPALFDNERMINGMIRMRLSHPYPQPAFAYARQAEACLAYDSRGRIGSVDAPTLVLAGGDDLIFPVELSRELAGAIPGAELRIIEGAGHAAAVERPEEFNAAVVEFLARHSET